jgi:hypothetical protein
MYLRHAKFIRKSEFAGAKCMLFIHQQIQSFLNLGGCKEFSIMAKPRSPKKTNGTKEIIPPTSVAIPAFDTGVTPAEAIAAGTNTTGTNGTKKTGTKKAAPKPEIVRTDARATVVPINLDEEIRRFAYLLSERRGFEPGHEAEDWLAAENEIRQRYHQQGA